MRKQERLKLMGRWICVLARRHSRALGHCFRLAAAIAAWAAIIAPSNAADIKLGWETSYGFEVVLEGPIVSGDYDKLQSFVETNDVQSVYLASPGGSVTEAIKIGRLVRELKLETITPVQVSGDLRKRIAERHKLTQSKRQLCVRQRVFLRVCCWRPEGPRPAWRPDTRHPQTLPDRR